MADLCRVHGRFIDTRIGWANDAPAGIETVASAFNRLAPVHATDSGDDRMLRNLLLAGLTAAALTPSLAQAQNDSQMRCRNEQNNNRVVGTVLGAVGGALLGNAIGQGGGREGGTIIGGVGGAVAGNVIGGASVNCGSNQYGYYDDSGRWVPNTATAYGYYDANGRWVDTANQGPPPPPPGYAPQVASGQPDGYGPPPPPPADAPRGAYEQQDAYGSPPPPPGDAYDRDHHDGDREQLASAPADTRERENWLENRIQQRLADGSIDQGRGRHALREVGDIRRMDADYRAYDGHLSDSQRQDIVARLDQVRAEVSNGDPGRPYAQQPY